jgi:hypothetical protein
MVQGNNLFPEPTCIIYKIIALLNVINLYGFHLIHTSFVIPIVIPLYYLPEFGNFS